MLPVIQAHQRLLTFEMHKERSGFPELVHLK